METKDILQDLKYLMTCHHGNQGYHAGSKVPHDLSPWSSYDIQYKPLFISMITKDILQVKFKYIIRTKILWWPRLLITKH